MVRKNPRVTSAEICNEVVRASEKSVSKSTIQRTLRRNGYSSRTARRKPLICEKNRQKRLTFANQHLMKGLDFCQTVLFTDESKFNIFGYDGPSKVWVRHLKTKICDVLLNMAEAA